MTTLEQAARKALAAANMNLRDQFAGLAMQGLLACGEAHDEHTHSITAAAAYSIADAMLAEREKQ